MAGPSPAMTNERASPGKRALARQDDADLGEGIGLAIDLDRSGMLLDHDVMADGKAEAGAFAGRLGGEEGIEHLLPHLGRNAGAIVAHADLDAIAQAFRRGGQNRLEAVARLRLAP